MPSCLSVTRRALVAVAAALVVASSGLACSTAGSSSAPDTGAGSAGASPTLADPSAPGPYGIGHRTVEVADDGRGRPLTVDIWYPTRPDAAGPGTVYRFLPTAFIASDSAVENAIPSTVGPFPLVVYSHGSGGVRYIASFLTERLASQGFVVAAADHTGDTATDEILGTAVTPATNDIDRPGDVSAVIDDVTARATSTTDPLSGVVDTEHVGVVGHSYGGYTALASVSGRTVPGGGTVEPDPRVDAVVAQAPYTERMTDAELEAVSVPTLLMVGSLDDVTPLATDTQRAFDLISGRPLVMVVLDAAGHQSFTDVCRYQKRLPELPDVPAALADLINRQAVEGCGPGLMDVVRAQSVADTLTVSFLQVQLAGLPGYEAWLGDGWANRQNDLVVSVKP